VADDETLDIALSRHRSEQAPVSLVVCDLNGLKRINDEQGHDAGDRSLIRFAGMLSAAASALPGAMAARLGGGPGAVNFSGGDSVALASGGGTHSDLRVRLAGALMVETSRTVIDKARRIAALLLDVGADEVSFTDGLFERRGETIDVGLERLRTAGTGGHHAHRPGDVLQLIRDRLGPEGADDDTGMLGVAWSA